MRYITDKLLYRSRGMICCCSFMIFSKCCNYIILEVVVDIVLYFVSVEDLEIVLCRLVDYEMILDFNIV